MVIKHNHHLAMAIQAVLVAMVMEDVWVIKEEAEGVPGKENGGSKGGRRPPSHAHPASH